MSVDVFHLNRPVHLARRDAFFEKADEYIRGLSKLETPSGQRRQAEKALHLFQEARRHALAANLSEQTSSQSHRFVDFIDMAIDNTQSTARMLRRQLFVNRDDSPLHKFLGGSETGNKMSGHYRRCAAHILKGLLLVLQQAEKPIDELQQNSFSKMNPVDRTRYEKAKTHFTKQADSEAERAVENLKDP
jgi:hypothetical protein